jgi:fructokinase
MILACGDALYDLFATDSSGLDFTFHGKIGGSPLNVAMGAARFGLNTGYLTQISTDMFGRKMMQFFADEKIDTSLIVRSDAPSTLSIVALSDAGVPDYSFYSNGTADVELTAADLPSQLDPRWQVIHLGSYSAAMNPSGQVLADFARANQDRFISYDPNIRPTVVADMAVWRERISSMTSIADLIKVSDEDLELVYGARPVAECAADFLADGTGLVIVTKGPDGAELWTKNASAHVDGVPAEVVDTVGAGDTFQAAVLTWLQENNCLSKEAIRRLSAEQLQSIGGFATRAAAITCARLGADLPYRHEIS